MGSWPDIHPTDLFNSDRCVDLSVVMKYNALSIVYPNGTRIASGEKKLEIRSWTPPEGFEGDLLIIENHNFLKKELNL